MEPTVIRTEKGFSLVEVMVALLVSLVTFLAVLETATLAIHTNLRNALRDEAVNVADISMNEARDVTFNATTDDLLAGTVNSTVTRNFRGADRDYAIRRTVTNVNADNKQVNVTVTWAWKGQTHTHVIQTLRRRA